MESDLVTNSSVTIVTAVFHISTNSTNVMGETGFWAWYIAYFVPVLVCLLIVAMAVGLSDRSKAQSDAEAKILSHPGDRPHAYGTTEVTPPLATNNHPAPYGTTETIPPLATNHLTPYGTTETTPPLETNSHPAPRYTDSSIATTCAKPHIDTSHPDTNKTLAEHAQTLVKTKSSFSDEHNLYWTLLPQH